MPRRHSLCKAVAIRSALLSWGTDHQRHFPWRSAGLSVYAVLIAEVLLKRTTATAAARVFPSFVTLFPDLRSIRYAQVSRLERALASVGLHRQRARGLKAIAEYLTTKHEGQVPDSLNELEKVPHLGPYSARAVLSFGHNIPAAIVDSNVIRVLGRVYTRLIGTSPSLSATQALADTLLDAGDHKTFNWALLDLGALVCRYDRPLCGQCPLAGSCDYFDLQSATGSQPG